MSNPTYQPGGSQTLLNGPNKLGVMPDQGGFSHA
jgi:hypothetical protein